MAYDISITGAYSGRPAYYLQLYVRRDNQSGNSSSYAWALYAHNPNGSSQTYHLTSQPWSVNVGGQVFNGSHNLDFRGGQTQILLGSGYTGWFAHDSSGNLTLIVDCWHGPAGIFGTADPAAAWFYTDRIPQVPGAPYSVGVDQATPTSLRYMFSGTSDGGSGILEWQAWADEDPNFASAIVIGSWGTSTFTGLTPGTQYYFRARGRNAVGWGPFSAVDGNSVGTTLPATAPGMTVTPAIAGTSATVALTPPSGSTSVSSYRVERRPVGGTAVSYNTTTSPLVVSPLEPGSVNEWRASALFGSYQTPWTDWVTIQQPNPNTNPGDYFDGSTEDRADTIYLWSSTENNSVSFAQGSTPLGWAAFEDGADVSGGAGVVMRATGGRSGDFCARVSFFSDTTVAGFHAGMGRFAPGVATTETGTGHEGLIHVQLPARSQRLAAMLLWVDAAGVEVGRTVGANSLIPASSTTWTPLRVSGTAPAGAVGVAVRVIDVQGAGWALWRGGDALRIDDAITPYGASYFDGDTPDGDGFIYEWEGEANLSPSTRTNDTSTLPDPLLDPDCPPVPAPPRPPFIDDSCVEEDVVEWRRVSATLGGSQPRTTPEWVSLVPTLEISALADIRLVRIRYYQNPFNRPLQDLNVDDYCAEQVITFIPAGAILTIDGITERLWAEVAGRSDSLPADHLLATQQGDTPQWAGLSCGIPYYLTVDVPVDVPSANLEIEYELTARYY